MGSGEWGDDPLLVDRFDLGRFVSAQDFRLHPQDSSVYQDAVRELTAGRKRTHWMWFIFPQLRGLGFSERSRHYGITGLPEARAYAEHPVLGERLNECVDLLLAIEGRSAAEIFGGPDDLKLRSSMTLFAQLGEGPIDAVGVLERYFDGESDDATLRLL